MIGRSAWEAHWHLEDGSNVIAAMRKAMSARTSHVLEDQRMFADGTARWFSYRIEPVPEGIRVYSLDIQYRKDTEAGAEFPPATYGHSEFCPHGHQ